MKPRFIEPSDVATSLYEKGFTDKIFISSFFFGKNGDSVWLYFSKNEDDFDASWVDVLVGETYDLMEDVSEVTADHIANMIIQKYESLEVRDA